MARPRSFLAMPLFATCDIGVVGVVVGVVVALHSVIVRVGAIVVLGVGSLLVSALELVDLLIGAGQWVRCPLGPTIVVCRMVVAPPCFSSVGGSFAGALVVLLDVGGNSLGVSVAPDRSSVDAFSWGASDDGVGLYASGGSKRSAVVGLPAIYVDTGIFVLPKFGEGGSEAADLVVEVGLGRDDVVASLQLESDCHFHPSGIPMHLAVAYAPFIGNERPSLRIDPVR